MDVTFPNSSAVVTNGFLTDSINCTITNDSSKPVDFNDFEVYSTNPYKFFIEITDPSLLGTLAPGESRSLSFDLDNAYEPYFVWSFSIMENLNLL